MKAGNKRFALGFSLLCAGCGVAPEPAPPVASSAEQALAADATYYVRSVYSGQVLDVVNGGTANGTPVQQWGRWNATNQQWALHALGHDVWELVGVGSHRCLDLTAGQPQNGAALELWDCTGGLPQQWRLVPTGGGAVTLANVGSGKCVDIAVSSQAQGGMAQQWTCGGTALNQQFILDPVQGSSPPAPAGRPRVAGSTLLDARGNPLRLRGVSIPGLEWGNGEPTPDRSPCFPGQTIEDTVQKALYGYHVNLVRLPISQDRWWNAVDGQARAYRVLVDKIVQAVIAAGAYIDLDLHWSDAGQWGKNLGQHSMPDDNTQTVLADLAARYARNPAVFIGLYNEPHDVNWNTWRNGGTVTESGVTYHTPGLEALTNAVRQQTSTVLIVGGLGWATDLTGAAGAYALSDKNVLYDVHLYPWDGAPAAWDRGISALAARAPILIGEFGANYEQLGAYASPQDFLSAMHAWLGQRGYSYAAWSMHPLATPSLISDWCYTPTAYFGAVAIPWLQAL